MGNDAFGVGMHDELGSLSESSQLRKPKGSEWVDAVIGGEVARVVMWVDAAKDEQELRNHCAFSAPINIVACCNVSSKAKSTEELEVDGKFGVANVGHVVKDIDLVVGWPK